MLDKRILKKSEHKQAHRDCDAKDGHCAAEEAYDTRTAQTFYNYCDTIGHERVCRQQTVAARAWHETAEENDRAGRDHGEHTGRLERPVAIGARTEE